MTTALVIVDMLRDFVDGRLANPAATPTIEQIGFLAGQRPRGSIELTQTTSDPELFAMLKTGQLDITFAMAPVPEGPFAAIELFADPFVVLTATDFALARRDGRLPVRELAELPLIAAQCCRYTSHVAAQLRERGLEPNVVHRSDDNGTVSSGSDGPPSCPRRSSPGWSA
jgi:DNA-binding transcriptional LysR family regulator